MRALLLTLSLLLSAAAYGADSFTLAQQLFQNGAPNLALARVVRDQPPAADAPGWFEWESLRLTLLSQLGRPGELLERVKAVPANAPKDFLQKVYGHAAWAHLERGDGVAARTYLARLLWGFALAPADYQWARRLVIRSYLVEHKSDEAYRAMLRYQQDFAPLSKDVAGEFAHGLLSEGHATEAMTWLVDLDPSSPTALRLQLKAGLLAPEAAIAQAQSALKAQPGSADYAGLMAEAAAMSGNARLRIEALERMLAAEEKPGSDRAAELWRAYVAQGEAAGNRAQLLQGDDASWLAVAAGLASADPRESRASYAYLVGRGASQDTRDLALAKLFAALVADRLETAAVRLFAAAPWGGEKASIDVIERVVRRAREGASADETRNLLMAAGRFAAEQGHFGVAADYYVQTVLASDMREPDLLATQALKSAIDNLERAGFKEDAAAFYRRMVGQREPVKKPAAAAKPNKVKRKK